MKRILFCDDFHDAGLADGHCCISCHDDVEQGYDDSIEIEPPPRPNGRKPTIYAHVCCSVSSQVKETRDNFAKALRAHRKRP